MDSFAFTTILCSLIVLLTISPIVSVIVVLEHDKTLVSPSGAFELGFFKPGNNSGWYLGIWYRNVPNNTAVWVANRDHPLSNKTGATLVISETQGKLAILDHLGNITWAARPTKEVVNPTLALLDSGKLVLQEIVSNHRTILWQSFDYPGDTLLPDMKLGWNLTSGLNRYLTSWNSSQDPSRGDYSIMLDYHGLPEIFVWYKQVKTFRSGPWNGANFSGMPQISNVDGYEFNLVTKQDEVYYSYSIQNQMECEYSALTVKPNGEIQLFTWNASKKTWRIFSYSPQDQCDKYGQCGPFGICNTKSKLLCNCVPGFRPKNRDAWKLGNGVAGCERKKLLKCRSDEFSKVKNVKLPESGGVFVDGNMNIEECKKMCSENCSCTAYANMEITNGGTGCVMWFKELIDMRKYADGGQIIYVRIATSPVAIASKKTKEEILFIVAMVALCVLVPGVGVCYTVRERHMYRKRNDPIEQSCPRERSQVFLLNDLGFTSKEFHSGMLNDEPELALIDLSTLALATDNFSDKNLLGEGGFGCVYKGSFEEGEEIAVKRLSKDSGQGTEEFKNEVKLIAKLQHVNLVRLLGCCIDGEEQMLIYEYMENKSLDDFLFSSVKRSMLNWKKRFNIICGIARGLVYLHQDSRFRIIHRDLKASNILLDAEFTPKISDFGMARIFCKDQNESHTKRVVGTYGYMSPEYALDGHFSTKSDVFSFGVLVLEIISGKMNKGYYCADKKPNLLDRTWKQWQEGKGLEIVDSSLVDSYCPHEMLRCIQVGLLCVQEHVVDRPTMSSVVFMLSSTSATMPQPKSPGFCLGRNPKSQTDSFSSKLESSYSMNQVTMTTLDGR